MKSIRFSFLLAAVALALAPLTVWADGRELATKKITELDTITSGNVVSSDYIPVYDASARAVKKMAATSFPIGGTVDVSTVTFSTALTGNPLMQQTMNTTTVAEANAGKIILASASGKKIYPGNPIMYVSGTAAGATAVLLECSGGTDIVSWPIAMLTTLQPVDAFVSKGGTVATRNPTMVSGCPTGEAVQVSVQGTLTTTTHLYFNVPYTVQ